MWIIFLEIVCVYLFNPQYGIGLSIWADLMQYVTHNYKNNTKNNISLSTWADIMNYVSQNHNNNLQKETVLVYQPGRT